MILSFFRKNKRCTSKVVGRIIGVHEFQSTDDEGHYNDSSYEPEFSYEVNGQVYHGWGGRSYRAPPAKFKSAVISISITIRKTRAIITPKAAIG